MIKYIFIYLIIGFVLSFLLVVVHDIASNIDDLPDEVPDETLEQYTPTQLLYIIFSWPFWLFLFVRSFFVSETK